MHICLHMCGGQRTTLDAILIHFSTFLICLKHDLSQAWSVPSQLWEATGLPSCLRGGKGGVGRGLEVHARHLAYSLPEFGGSDL